MPNREGVGARPHPLATQPRERGELLHWIARLRHSELRARIVELRRHGSWQEAAANEAPAVAVTKTAAVAATAVAATTVAALRETIGDGEPREESGSRNRSDHLACHGMLCRLVFQNRTIRDSSDLTPSYAVRL
jgi:hypothetical protein